MVPPLSFSLPSSSPPSCSYPWLPIVVSLCLTDLLLEVASPIIFLPSPFCCHWTSRIEGLHWWRRSKTYKLHIELHQLFLLIRREEKWEKVATFHSSYTPQTNTHFSIEFIFRCLTLDQRRNSVKGEGSCFIDQDRKILVGTFNTHRRAKVKFPSITRVYGND